jgi:hypothetical protein
MRQAWVPGEVDPTRPSVARVYDFYLGGSHNFASDREFGRQALQAMPNLTALVLEYRTFLRRVVQHLCARGIDQFLDLGSGIPTVGNVHEIAQAAIPHARVVYVDHDPVAVAHGTALLRDNPRATSVLCDIREPERVLTEATASGILDLSRPVAVLVVAVLHFVPDEDRPAEFLAQYMAATAPGSFLAISQARSDGESEARRVARIYDEDKGSPSRRTRLRTKAEIEELFSGLIVEDPGVVALPRWHPEVDVDGPAPAEVPPDFPILGGLGRRP